MPRARFTLEATAADVRRTRGRICAAVRSWGVPLDAEAHLRLELVASELLTNGLVHAGGRMTAEVALTGSFLVVEVHDDSPRLPRRREADVDDERGRGLALVEACCLFSGAETTDGGKRCFAVLSVAGAVRDTPAGPALHDVGGAAGSARWTLTPTARRLLPDLLSDLSAPDEDTGADTGADALPGRARA
ncbi:ATP-binding protein [Streptomyces seoulensis]|nr:ATP-binding protein [Streptomyces seoulensis]